VSVCRGNEVQRGLKEIGVIENITEAITKLMYFIEQKKIAPKKILKTILKLFYEEK
jgi:hypothetical protein